MQFYNLTDTPTCRMVTSYFYTFQMWYVNFEQSETHSVPRYTQSRIVFFDWCSKELPCALNTHIAGYSRNTTSVSIWDFPSTLSAEEPLSYLEIFVGFSYILNSHTIQLHKGNSILYSAPYILVTWHTPNTQNYTITSGICVPDGGDHEECDVMPLLINANKYQIVWSQRHNTEQYVLLFFRCGTSSGT
jgi:hypothetical protein